MRHACSRHLQQRPGSCAGRHAPGVKGCMCRYRGRPPDRARVATGDTAGRPTRPLCCCSCLVLAASMLASWPCRVDAPAGRRPAYSARRPRPPAGRDAEAYVSPRRTDDMGCRRGDARSFVRDGTCPHVPNKGGIVCTCDRSIE
jgi:hypothetical protein